MTGGAAVRNSAREGAYVTRGLNTEGVTLRMNGTNCSRNGAERGGCVNSVDTSASFANCAFEDNEASSLGGALYLEHSTSSLASSLVNMSACAFSRNAAISGASAARFLREGFLRVGSETDECTSTCELALSSK